MILVFSQQLFYDGRFCFLFFVKFTIVALIAISKKNSFALIY